jgi:hypothetical protein
MEVEVLEVSTPARLKELDALTRESLDIDGGKYMMDLLAQTGEPLIPWLQKVGLKAKPEITVKKNHLSSKRSEWSSRMN